MSLVIRAAARMLPAGIRDRYREQWLADARDAPEAGIRPSSIALAALAFAVTYDRPLPAPRVPTAEQRAQRSRLAVGLALSAALLALSAYPRIGFTGLTGIAAWDFAAFFASALLMAYAVAAPVLALVLARGRRHRVIVMLLAAASLSSILASLGVGGAPNIYLNGAVPFAIAALLIIIAAGMLWRPSGRSRVAPLMSALAVWAVTAIGLIYAAGIAWPNRDPIVYGEPTDAYYAEWLRLKNEFEATVNQAFVGWAIAGLVLGVAVLVMGRRMSERDAAGLGVAAVAVTLLGASGVFGLLELGVGGTIPDPLLDPLRLVSTVLLVGTTLVAVGGVRYLPRVRHRHDVESGVELL